MYNTQIGTGNYIYPTVLINNFLVKLKNSSSHFLPHKSNENKKNTKSFNIRVKGLNNLMSPTRRPNRFKRAESNLLAY